MSNREKKQYDIFTFAELQIARQNLKQVIEEQENTLRNNPFVKISNSLYNPSSLTKSLKGGFSDLNLKSAENIASSLLLAFKSTRKYFVGFLIAKEMVPFVIKKVNEVVKSKKLEE